MELNRKLGRDGVLALVAILLFAAALRLAFFNGFFGSDDLVYLQRSVEISNGVWSSASYNGALRYGYNLPAALFIFLFGLNAFTANLWTLLCSLGEVALVYVFVSRFVGFKAAVYAGLVLACLPLHIALGTRIHADSVLAFFLTLSFVLFYWAERSQSRRLYFAAGLALGMIFWSKELAAITFLAFLTYPLVVWRLNKDWGWVVVGGLVMLSGHFLLMQMIAGDPLHLIKTVTGQVQTGFVHGGAGEDAAWYYFKYLFVDIKHTWIAPFVAIVGLFVVFARSQALPTSQTLVYVAWWLISLLVVLSFTPVSLSPFRLVMKQSNYLNLFLAPIAIFSGIALSRLNSRSLAMGLGGLIVFGGVFLGAMQQQSYRLYSANSRAAVDFLLSRPGDWMMGSFNNVNVARVAAILGSDPTLEDRFGYLSLDNASNREKAPLVGSKDFGFVVVDQQTQAWGRKQTSLVAIPSCWVRVQDIDPAMDGLGYSLLMGALSTTKLLPGSLGQVLERKIFYYAVPLPATIYRVEYSNLWCGSEPIR